MVDKERQVVKNEKRQGVDNQPYGHTGFVIDRALYPEEHPYSWQVIGSLADLDAASLADVKEFHGRWYGPDNATLVVAGDLDVDQTKAWIEKSDHEYVSATAKDEVVTVVIVCEGTLPPEEELSADLAGRLYGMKVRVEALPSQSFQFESG